VWRRPVGGVGRGGGAAGRRGGGAAGRQGGGATDAPVDGVEEEVRVRLAGGGRQPGGPEVLHGVARRPEVDGAALGEEHELVEQLEHLARRLVDDRQHRLAARGQAADGRHHEVGGRRVQARGRLVQEQDGRAGHELHADRDAALLPPRDPTQRPVPDEGVGRLGHPELREQVVDELLALRGRQPGHADAGGVGERLPHRQRAHEEVVLGDVRRLAVREVRGVPVDGQLPRHIDVLGRTTGQAVEEGGLAGARRTHDGEQMTWLAVPVDSVEDEAPPPPDSRGGNNLRGRLEAG